VQLLKACKVVVFHSDLLMVNPLSEGFPWLNDDMKVISTFSRKSTTPLGGAAAFGKNLRDFTLDLYYTIRKKSPEASSYAPNLVASLYVPGKGVWFSTIPVVMLQT
jgi:hypothetical protein